MIWVWINLFNREENIGSNTPVQRLQMQAVGIMAAANDVTGIGRTKTIKESGHWNRG